MNREVFKFWAFKVFFLGKICFPIWWTEHITYILVIKKSVISPAARPPSICKKWSGTFFPGNLSVGSSHPKNVKIRILSESFWWAIRARGVNSEGGGSCETEHIGFFLYFWSKMLFSSPPILFPSDCITLCVASRFLVGYRGLTSTMCGNFLKFFISNLDSNFWTR